MKEKIWSKDDVEFRTAVPLDNIARTKKHVFMVQENCTDEYQAVFPEPLADFSVCFKDHLSAVTWLVMVKEKHVNGKQWELDKPKEYAQMLYDQLGDTRRRLSSLHKRHRPI